MRKMATIDPADWLAGHDIKGYLDARYGGDDPLALGREALALASGDLLTACQQYESLRAEICLAWLHGQIGRQPECAPLEMVRLAERAMTASQYTATRQAAWWYYHIW